MRDLGSQVVIAGGNKLAAGSLAKASMPISGVPLVREAQLLAGVDPATFAAQPFLSDADVTTGSWAIGLFALLLAFYYLALPPR